MSEGTVSDVTALFTVSLLSVYYFLKHRKEMKGFVNIMHSYHHYVWPSENGSLYPMHTENPFWLVVSLLILYIFMCIFRVQSGTPC